MILKKIVRLTVFFIFITGCSATSPTASTANFGNISCSPTTFTPPTGNNVMSISVGSCPGGYENEPCTSVTICDTSNANCQTINNILVDTGSYGLRIFKSAITSFTPAYLNYSGATTGPASTTGGTGTQVECTYFGTGTEWGPVANVYVKLGGESAVLTPIQVVDSTYFASQTSKCSSSVEVSPSAEGYNGILGVGLQSNDCPGCTYADKRYFACTGSTCTAVTPTTSNPAQVTNPVSLLSTDNNGVVIQMNNVCPGGASTSSGSLILGVGTQSNNTPASSVVAYGANSTAGSSSFLTFQTTYNSTTSRGFIDSGSNGIFFYSPTIATCSDNDFLCPAATSTLSATMKANSGSPTVSIPFYVSNADDLFNTGNYAYSDLSANGGSGSQFDWGINFYYGRTIYHVINGSSATFNGVSKSGPLWGF